MNSFRILLLLFMIVAGATAALARDLGGGALPIKVDAVPPLALASDEEIRLEGIVEATSNVVVVLRIDDMNSWSYATRFNGERTLPPGSFRWVIGANGLKTASGRFLDPGALRRMVLFLAKGDARVSISKFEIARAPRLPEGAKGYSLGPREAEVPAGFERIAPDDARISGARLFGVHRPAPDPLVASGVRGIERLALPWPQGRARVTLWHEDPGEWELMPHSLERRIRVNGVEALSQRHSPADWISSRYLRGLTIEHGADDDAWTGYGRQRGAAVTVSVDVGADGIVVELAGQGAEALYLSAVLVEPGHSHTARDQVEAARADWYRMTWPVVPAVHVKSRPPLTITLPAGDGPFEARPLRATAAAGTGTRLTVAIRSEAAIAHPAVSLLAPALGSVRLDGKVWASQRRLERRRAGDSVLSLDDNMLAGDTTRLELAAGAPRTYELWISTPQDAPPGLYRGALVIGGETARERAVPVEIEVVDVVLPRAVKPAGYYLDEAPHLTWFAATSDERARQTACDLAFMAALGLDGSAPALATPKDTSGRFEADMARAAEARVATPWLAYAPAKRLLAGLGVEKSAAALARLEGTLAASGLMPPVWSVADEPSNPDNPETRMRNWIAAIRAAAPAARLAGHLNSPSDRRLASLFDVVLVNDGYGLDVDRIADVAAPDHEVWLYNTARPRVTAGLWLWKTAARRYVQWHARMPTADPFDPTDGREGDVQMLMPEARSCPAVPTIHRDVLEMAEGVVDQRWLAWLDANPSAPARVLSARLRTDLARDWSGAAALGPDELLEMRESIIGLTR